MSFGSWRTAQGLAAAGMAVLAAAAAAYWSAHYTASELVKANARLEAERWASQVETALSNQAKSDAGPSIMALLDDADLHGQVLTLQLNTAHGVASFTSSRNAAKAAVAGPTSAKPASSAVELIWSDGSGTASVRSLFKAPLHRNQDVAGWMILQSDQSSLYAAAFNQLLAAAGSLALAILLAIGGAQFLFSHRKRKEQQADGSESLRDPLTGLPNKPAMLLSIGQKLGAVSDERQLGAVILCEAAVPLGVVQNFGEEAEEALILATAGRLVSLSKGRYDTARTGRLAFGLSLNGASDAMEVLALAKELTVRLGEPVEWHGQSLAVTAHAGIALSTSDGETPEALLRSAELALHAAQEQGTPGYGFFNPEIAKDIRRQSAIQRAVSAAAASQSFRLDYQPVYNIRTGELTGFEALIRMHDAELGAVSPAEFIPVAEQMGLINTIGAWCLQEACRTASEWPPHLQVAVNLSPAQFMSGSLVSDVRHALEQARLPAYRLEVEITEGTLLNSSEAVLTQLRSLRDMGIAVALDDFGTGYSSLGYLWKFPFSKLKIDRSFVQALEESPSAKGILRSIVKLGHGLGLTVTAEGIETQKQFGVLRDLGCDLAQGYLLDRPARVADIAAIILRNFANGLHRRTRDIAIAEKSAA